MSKQKLILEEDNYSYLVFGISCHWKDFRVAWVLNKEAGFNLARKDNLEITTGKEGTRSSHSLFVQQDPENHVQYLLTTNNGSSGSLSKAYKEFDYFLIVEGYTDLYDAEALLGKLKAIKNFQLVMEVPSDALSKWQYDLFDR